MAMVSLLISSLTDGVDDWEYWYIGTVILVICIIVSLVLMYLNILTWQDPLGTVQEESKEPTQVSVVPVRASAVRYATALLS